MYIKYIIIVCDTYCNCANSVLKYLQGVDNMNRKSGILMHVSSLWGNYSIGGFGRAAKEFIDILKSAGFTYWQVLPFCVPDEYNSPYKSYSAFSINPYFIDLEMLYEKGLITHDELDSARQISPHLSEFDRLKEERLALLSKASKRFNHGLCESFLKSHPHTAEFCRFMALKSANSDKPWQEWNIDTPNKDVMSLWQFCQYEAFEQWMEIKNYANCKGIQIIGDIPIYVALDSSDVWSAPEEFQLDKRYLPTSVAGVPPDYFSKDGQLWGNPLYNWTKMRKDGYRWWCDRMSFMCELFDGVRIDHFRGLESYFSIPANETTARNGKWKKGPGMAFIKKIRECTEGKLIIAEDLGDITPAVDKLVRDSTFPGMRVLQFGLLGGNNSLHLPHNYINNCIAYTGTHDNNTLLGYVWELGEDERKTFIDYFGHDNQSFDTCYDTVMRSMLGSHAGTVIFPVQDILKYGSDTRLNTPGSSDKNWAYRVTKEQIDTVDIGKFKYWNTLYGR
ncbi:MAG: 4-alpha-glucanotransferase [Ruminococcaceae bacterium]|nr:4-alpha-glucanotransferase [Oscillospiraceae bacterium]